MTIEEVIGNLSDKYGEKFNWWMIPLTQSRGFFVEELKRELGEENVIFRNRVYAVARCIANDDVLYLICDGSTEGLWRIYHLTYTSGNSAEFPCYKEFTSRIAVGEFIEEQFIHEFL